MKSIFTFLVQMVLAAQQFLLGTAFEDPGAISTDPNIRSALANITAALNGVLLEGKTQYGQETGNATALSVRIVSAHDNAYLFDFHHTPDTLNTSTGSVSNVTSDSMYRIGSISKLFTVYALLLNSGLEIWLKSVTDFVPELKAAASNNGSAVETVRWQEVTVRALASQLAGIARDGT